MRRCTTSIIPRFFAPRGSACLVLLAFSVFAKAFRIFWAEPLGFLPRRGLPGSVCRARSGNSGSGLATPVEVYFCKISVILPRAVALLFRVL